MEHTPAARALERRVFRYGNRYLMTPLLQAGLARFMGCPACGYFMLLRTTGHRSGKPRLTPLNYAIDGGNIVCLAGFGEGAHWLANLRADARAEVRLPACTVDGTAAVVQDPAESQRLAVKVARNSGFALVFEHPRCLLMSDAQLARRLEGRPVVRITPVSGPVVAGPYDPGGRGWILPALAQLLALIGGIAFARRAAASST